MRAWGAAVSTGHVVLGALGWLLLGVPPVFFAGCAAVTLAIALLAAPLMRPRPDDGEGGEGGEGPPTPDGGEPPWWPDFERAFRAYSEAYRSDRCVT
jgi:hypothetical protein